MFEFCLVADCREIVTGGDLTLLMCLKYPNAKPDTVVACDCEHHCHIKKGQPTFVVVWREDKGRIRFVEVTYAGTHENAPY